MTWNSIQLKFVISTSVFLLVSGCSTSTPAPVMSLTHPLTQVNKPDYSQLQRGSYSGSYYEVQKGETLYFIAYITNQDVNDLIRINQLPPPHTIYPGQKLKLWSDGSTNGQTQIATSQSQNPDVVITPIPTLPKPSDLDKSAEETIVEVAATKASPEPKTEPKPEPKPEVKPIPEPKPAVVKAPVTPPSVSLADNKSQTANSSQKTVSEITKQTQAVDIDKSKGYSQTATKPKQEVNKEETKQAIANVEVKKDKPKPAPKPTPSPPTKVEKITWDWPTKGRVVAGFSNSESGNKGLDIAGSYGQDIVAAGDGRVMYAGNALRGYGNLIIIKHNDDYLSAYAHNDNLLVSEGQNIKQGQKIASMGSSGTDSVRLHFEIRYKGKSVNPLRYLPKQ